MTKTQILELERTYKFFCLKKWVKRTFAFLVFVLFLGVSAGFYQFYKDKKIDEKIVQKNKFELQQRLENAKTQALKTQVLHEKELLKKDEKINHLQNELDKKEALKLKIKSYELSIKSLEQSFLKNENIEIALRLAHYYFNKKDYKKALKYSFRANTMDKSRAESWLLYSKSLLGLGKKDEAQRVLDLYKQYFK